MREAEQRLSDIEKALRDLPDYIARAAGDAAETAATKVREKVDRLDVNVTRAVRALQRDVRSLESPRDGAARTR